MPSVGVTMTSTSTSTSKTGSACQWWMKRPGRTARTPVAAHPHGNLTPAVPNAVKLPVVAATGSRSHTPSD